MSNAIEERSPATAIDRPGLDANETRVLLNGNGKVASVAPEVPPRRRKRWPLLIFGLIVLVGIIVAIVFYMGSLNYESTDDAYIQSHVVAVKSQIGAKVLQVLITDNQLVKKGDLLVKLDPTEFDQALKEAQGAAAAAQGKLTEATAEVNTVNAQRDEAIAEVAAAQSTLDNADSQLQRYQALDVRARSKIELDNVIASQKSAAAQLAQAKAKLAEAAARIVSTAASVTAAQGSRDQANAEVERARTNLGYCEIRADQDGRITQKNVEPGAYVAKEADLFALVPPEVWVVANFKETQLDHIHAGQAVDISVDAYPDHVYHGRIDSIQPGTGSRFSMLPAENASGNFVKVVQRVPVKIVFDSPDPSDADHVLSAGMSVTPNVHLH